MLKKDVAQKKFLEWLKKNEPFLFDVAMKRHKDKVTKAKASGLGFIDLGSFNLADFVKTAADTIKTVAPQVVQVKAQSDLLKAQVKRAQAGQPPLDAAQYLSTQAQSPQQYIPSVDQYNAAAVAAAARSQPQQNYLPWILGGGSLLAMVFLLRKRAG